MRIKIFLLVAIGLLTISCTKDEKNLASILKNIQESKTKLLASKDFPNLNSENLVLLKSYSDFIDQGQQVFLQLLNKRSSKKRMIKTLLKSEYLASVCSVLFVSETNLSNINKQCMDGPFNVCPLSFSKYMNSSKNTINKIKELLGVDAFSKTDCSNYYSQEVSNVL